MFISSLFTIKEKLEIKTTEEDLVKVGYMKYYVSIKTTCNNLGCWVVADLPEASINTWYREQGFSEPSGSLLMPL